MLKSLIKNQTIQVDAHKRGTGEQIVWDSTANDIHIHKRTQYKVDGKILSLDIKVPVNSDRDIEISIVNNVRDKRKMLSIAERRVLSEIAKALSDKKTRTAFIEELLSVLDSYEKTFLSKENAQSVVKRLAKHFGLPAEISREITTYAEDRLASLTGLFQQKNEEYFISLSQNGIVAGQVERVYNPIKNRKRR